MKQYDVIVIGSGAGTIIVDEALMKGLKVALVDRGPIGGTCLNLGCVPSKMLIYPADRIVEIQEAKKLGITAEVKNIDFASIMERMRKSRAESQAYIRKSITEEPDKPGFYEREGHFVEDYTMEIDGEKIKGKKVFIASGSRPVIPPIKGLDGIDFLTNENALELTRRPDSLLIIGGGYVAVEFAHFFAAVGTKVTIVEMLSRIAQSEEPEISQLLEKEMKRRMKIYTNTQVEEIRKDARGAIVVATDKASGKRIEFPAERVMVAVGRRSNADLLKVENTGVEVDKRGYIKVDEYLETTKKNIFAIGDANGQQMFTHVANREATVAWHNSTHKNRIRMDYSAAPHAVYAHPQIASVGLGEENAKKDYHILVGRAKYFDTAKGEAMMEEEGFAKAIVDAHSGRILGFHIIGPNAPELIQEVINAMANGEGVHSINEGMHIHPAMPELITKTFDNLEPAE
ncbi:MAG TPA: dihydrolipoyl dehydrogenase [Dehalococcoidia bacterium]|nr:dihydrolipoyl dehydrogenase [Dehalococcoidia bacterium]